MGSVLGVGWLPGPEEVGEFLILQVWGRDGTSAVGGGGGWGWEEGLTLCS